MSRSLVLFLVMLVLPATARAGLDITAYRGLTLVPSPRLDADGLPIGPREVMLEPVNDPERFEPLKPGAVYRYAEAFEFRAGSYSGYNEWRNELARLAGNKPTATPGDDGKMQPRYDETVWRDKSGPFWELIDFSDSEGVIGPLACKRVLGDFVRFHEAAKAHPDEGFRESYEDWMKAFALCAEGGAIEFH